MAAAEEAGRGAILLVAPKTAATPNGLRLIGALRGLANAAAGLAGAGGAWLCGRAIDAGGRDRYLALVSIALGAGFALRAAAGFDPHYLRLEHEPADINGN